MQIQPIYYSSSINNHPKSHNFHQLQTHHHLQNQYSAIPFKTLNTHLPINQMSIYQPSQLRNNFYHRHQSSSTIQQRQTPMIHDHNPKIFIKFNNQQDNNMSSQNHFSLVNSAGYTINNRNQSNTRGNLRINQNHDRINQKGHFLHHDRDYEKDMYQFKPLKRTDQVEFIRRSMKISAEKAIMIQNILQTEDQQHTKCKCKNEVNYNVIQEDDKTDAPYCRKWC